MGVKRSKREGCSNQSTSGVENNPRKTFTLDAQNFISSSFVVIESTGLEERPAEPHKQSGVSPLCLVVIAKRISEARIGDKCQSRFFVVPCPVASRVWTGNSSAERICRRGIPLLSGSPRELVDQKASPPARPPFLDSDGVLGTQHPPANALQRMRQSRFLSLPRFVEKYRKKKKETVEPKLGSKLWLRKGFVVSGYGARNNATL